jgi:hypothetical protein
MADSRTTESESWLKPGTTSAFKPVVTAVFANDINRTVFNNRMFTLRLINPLKIDIHFSGGKAVSGYGAYQIGEV